MLQKQNTGSIGCPSCGSWVSVQAKNCPDCGYWNPGFWGYYRYVRILDADFFAKIVIYTCVTLYAISLLLDPTKISLDGIFHLLGPSVRSLVILGGSGYDPIVDYKSWWTVFTAPYLHCGLIHLFFNMTWIKDSSHLIVKFYSFSKLVIIYTFSGISGLILTTLAAKFLPSVFAGAHLSAGASGAIFGLFGALVSYGQQSGSSAVRDSAWQYALVGFICGFLSPSVDNWGHVGGFIGGYTLTHIKWLNYKYKDNNYLFFLAMFCFLAVIASFIASFIKGIFVMKIFEIWD
ncbi:MAG: rhomboid family intramembrane serine protease [Candidatus Melainabacteria bacterium]|jgi:rhomboid protease GluP